MTGRDRSSGGMTGATGDLTADDDPRAFEPGELREVESDEGHAAVTSAQARHAPEHADVDPRSGEDRAPRIGGDEAAESEDRL
jgi:hypothetical protein